MSIVNVRHIDKNTVRIDPEVGYNVTVFNKGDGIDVMVSDGTDTVRIKLVAPEPGQEVMIRSCDGYALEVLYTTKGPDDAFI